MERGIRFCTTADGVRIAYEVIGTGYPLVAIPGWISHLELDRQFPSYRFSIEDLAQDFTLIRYDKRGCGLSDRAVNDFSYEKRILDLEAVVADLKLDRFALHAYSEGGPVAIAYAAADPRSVSHLIIIGGFARGPQPSDPSTGHGDPFAGETGAIVEFVRSNWGAGSMLLADMFLPDATADERQWFMRYQRESASAQGAADMLRANLLTDVTHLLPSIKAPTLIFHGTNDVLIPIVRGREMAAGINGARFVPYEGRHIAEIEIQAENNSTIREFVLGAARRPAALAQTGQQFVTMVFTDIERNTQILDRLGDAAWRALLREHEAITRDLLKRHGGKEIKTIGDAFMASFGSATSALECSIALQRAFTSRNDSANEPIMMRVGINAGEPIAEDGDLFGTAVTTASRIAGLAAGGEILASNVVRELVAGKGFLFSDRGDNALRGFEDPVRLYEVRWHDA